MTSPRTQPENIPPIRKPKMKSLKILVPTAVLALMLGSCGGGDQQQAGAKPGSADEPTRGGEVTVAVEVAPRPLDPTMMRNVSDRTVASQVYEPLLKTDSKGKTQPWLAKEFDVSEDGKQIKLTVRNDVKFHDGTSLDAAAVKFNLDRMKDPASECTCLTDFDPMKSVEVESNDVVVITLKRADQSFMTSVLAGQGGFMASPTAIKKYGKKYPQHPAGTGPFKFDHEVAGSEVDLLRWEDYWRPKLPYLDKVSFKVMTDVQARLTSVQSGAVDIAEVMEPTQVHQAESQPNLTVQENLGYSNYYLVFNTTRPPFDSLQARRAVCAATDTEAVNKSLYFGLYQPGASSPYSLTHPWYPGDEVGKHKSLDVDRARQLVKELGGLKFTILTQRLPETATALQAQWKKVGMDVKVQLGEITAVTDAGLKHQYDVMIGRNGPTSSDPSDPIDSWFTSGGSWNQSGISDPDVDKLIAQARTTLDHEERQQIYADISRKLLDRVDRCYLWTNTFWRIMNSSVKNVPTDPGGTLHLDKAYVTSND